MASHSPADKDTISERASGDPEWNGALSSAHHYQLGLEKEKHRHVEEMRGLFSRLFGHGDNVATYIAAIGMSAGVAIIVGCLIAATITGAPMDDFWAKQAEKAFGFSSTCLAFIFGRGSSKNE